MQSQLFDISPDEMQRLFDKSDSMADVLRTLGYSPYGGDHPTLRRYIDQYDIDLTKLTENRLKKQSVQIQKKSLEDILSGKVEYANSNKLKYRLINEGYKERKCELCGLTEWLGKPIPIELDHIDGDHSNNRLENLRIVCPNCHASGENYCGRNTKAYKRGKQEKGQKRLRRAEQKANDLDYYDRSYEERSRAPGKEILKNEIRTQSFLTLGRKYGVSDNSVRKWCIHYGLPHRRADIKKMSDEDWAKL